MKTVPTPRFVPPPLRLTRAVAHIRLDQPLHVRQLRPPRLSVVWPGSPGFAPAPPLRE